MTKDDSKRIVDSGVWKGWVAVDEEYLRSMSVDVGECWEWTGPQSKDGSPRAYLLPGGYAKFVRRVYLQQKGTPKNNPFPKNWRSFVTCDNLNCVRPDHIKAVAPAKIARANVAKMNKSLRSAKMRATQRRKHSLINDEQRALILSSDLRHRDIAQQMGLDKKYVYQVRKRAQDLHTLDLGIFNGLMVS